tara:strand:+ start:555 stop:686 length:132 start_codon:yes stop_codon:yes gene_type:complete
MSIIEILKADIGSGRINVKKGVEILTQLAQLSDTDAWHLLVMP